MRVSFGHFFLLLALFLNATPAFAGLFSNFKRTFDNTYNEVLSRMPEPPNFDFWKHAQGLADRVVNYANMTLLEEAIKNSVPLEQIYELENEVYDLLTVTKTFSMGLQGSPDLDRPSSEMATLVERFSVEIDELLEDLRDEFREPLPENKTERCSRREAEVTIILDKIEDTLVRICANGNISETELREKFIPVKSYTKHIILVIGIIADRHPIMFDIMMFFVAVVIAGPIIEGLLCRALLRVFGFSALGPTRGSFASWAQKRFFGAVVKRGSWFARLQSAGMDPKAVFGLGTKVLAGALAVLFVSIRAITGF